MPSLAQLNPEEWHQLHDTLRDALQKEIHLTRELLSNMHQEEVSLMLHDNGSLNAIMQYRAGLLERLSLIRLHRSETTDKIIKIVGKDHKQPSLDEILPPDEEITIEILSLSDQLMALTERMNRQHHQNLHLAEHPEHNRYPQLQPAADPRPKKKASVATYQIKK